MPRSLGKTASRAAALFMSPGSSAAGAGMRPPSRRRRRWPAGPDVPCRPGSSGAHEGSPPAEPRRLRRWGSWSPWTSSTSAWTALRASGGGGTPGRRMTAAIACRSLPDARASATTSPITVGYPAPPAARAAVIIAPLSGRKMLPPTPADHESAKTAGLGGLEPEQQLPAEREADRVDGSGGKALFGQLHEIGIPAGITGSSLRPVTGQVDENGRPAGGQELPAQWRVAPGALGGGDPPVQEQYGWGRPGTAHPASRSSTESLCGATKIAHSSLRVISHSAPRRATSSRASQMACRSSIDSGPGPRPCRQRWCRPGMAGDACSSGTAARW